jgi:DNA polymerase alpha-associated DNA helicase A
MLDIQAFASLQLSLLDKELQAELAETQLLTSTHAPTTLQRAGLAVLNLNVSSQRTGLGGKTLLELSLDPAVGSGELPEHVLRVGDICGVAEQPKGAERKKERDGMEKRGIEGVITKLHRETVTVALDKEDADVPNGKLWLYVSARFMVGATRKLIFLPFSESNSQMMLRGSV